MSAAGFDAAWSVQPGFYRSAVGAAYTVKLKRPQISDWNAGRAGSQTEMDVVCSIMQAAFDPWVVSPCHVMGLSDAGRGVMAVVEAKWSVRGCDGQTREK